ncbi:MAG TPA: hypothetical protein DDW76_15405 [Cyanobacteria bacterium UBA11369]|nr:hypothetical protein [Cyanobacteria bacterium UBA11371]HBE34100.1 hypothetical protein [Cyanobacteria bacterium UBA11368]HBE50141.1 hypothetical protein [Cyanobacteria bacterium UBA11369]
MLQAIEGVYKNGTIKLAEIPKAISESRVIVTFLEVKPTLKTGQMMYFGMFSGANQSTENDFSV